MITPSKLQGRSLWWVGLAGAISVKNVQSGSEFSGQAGWNREFVTRPFIRLKGRVFFSFTSLDTLSCGCPGRF